MSNLLYDIWVVTRLVGAAIDEAVAATGLTAREFTLYALIDSAGPITPSDIARRTGVPATSISKLLKRMDQRGHLVMKPSATDGRSRTVGLSDGGRRVLGVAEASFSALVDRVATDLGEDEAIVSWAMARLDAVLRNEEGAPIRPPISGDQAVAYPGDPLTTEQTVEVTRFIDWLRVRDG